MVKEDPSLMVERENPNSESCQGLTSYNRGLFGRPSYFKCVNCGENQTAKL